MKSDEQLTDERSRVEAVETLLSDKRIDENLRDEIRGHFRISQSHSSADQDALFRCVLKLQAIDKIALVLGKKQWQY
jgi:hypothetical protein